MIIHFDLILIIITSPISPHHPKSPHHFVICHQFVIVIEKYLYLWYKCHPIPILRTISYIMFHLQQLLLLRDVMWGGSHHTVLPPGGICISPQTWLVHHNSRCELFALRITLYKCNSGFSLYKLNVWLVWCSCRQKKMYETILKVWTGLVTDCN